MRFWTIPALALAVACSGSKDSSDKSDTGSNDSTADSSDTSTRTDTYVHSGTDTEDSGGNGLCPGSGPRDPTADPALGPTALDGDWVGNFRYREEYPKRYFNNNAPTCEATISVKIDGCGTRHIMGTLDCSTWDPNQLDIPFPSVPGFPPLPALATPYGPMNGLVFGELDPANLNHVKIAVEVTWTGLLLSLGKNNHLDLETDVENGNRMAFSWTRTRSPMPGLIPPVPQTFDMILCRVGSTCDATLPALPVDTGSADTGTADTGSVDSGAVDSGTTDSGTADSGTIDSGTADSGTIDSGTVDSGTIDSGGADTGSADTGAAAE